MDAWVVVVDDDVSNLKMAGYILSKNNMRVTALKSGRALLDYVSVNQPDLILLDIMMPDMDGFTTLQKLRERETGKDTFLKKIAKSIDYQFVLDMNYTVVKLG